MKRCQTLQECQKKRIRQKKVPLELEGEQSKEEVTRDLVVSKKKMKVPKKKVPDELKVLKDMDVDELKRYFFPCNPKKPWDEQLIIADEGNEISSSNAQLKHVNHLTSQLRDSIRKECEKTNGICETNIKLAHPVNIESLLFPRREDYLLRRDGCKVKAKTLRGKYILICSFHVPDYWTSSAWQAVVSCSEMYSKLKGDFEMVIATCMRYGWSRDKDAFNQFFSPFPSSCLAVPFHAKSRRYHVCKYLGGTLKVLLVAPDGNALLHSHLNDLSLDLDLIPMYGSDSTPFPCIPRKYVSVTDKNGKTHTKPTVTAAQQKVFGCMTPSSLEEILCCDTSDFVFRRVPKISQKSNVIRFRKEKLSISELKSKHVGLYLCATGEMLPVLGKIVAACRQSGKQLEIVLVYLWRYGYDPRYYAEVLSKVLAKRNIPCWVAPFNNTAAVVLRRMFDQEKVMIVGPNGLNVDTRGVELMQIYGKYGYPFTLDGIVQQTVEELRQVTLESFFELLKMGNGNGSTGKKVLFYFDYPNYICPKVLDEVRAYTMLEDAYLYIISFTDEKQFQKHAKNLKLEECNPLDYTLKVRWHTKGADKSRDFFLKFFNHEFPTIVAFVDGKICSVCAHLHPSYLHPSSEVQIKSNLVTEVSSLLKEYLDNYVDNESRYDLDPDYLKDIHAAKQSMLW